MPSIPLLVLIAGFAIAEPGADQSAEEKSPVLSEKSFQKENPKKDPTEHGQLVKDIVDGSSGRYKKTKNGGLLDDTVDPPRKLTVRDAERLQDLYALRKTLAKPPLTAKGKKNFKAALLKSAEAIEADPALFYPDKTPGEARLAAKEAADGLRHLTRPKERRFAGGDDKPVTAKSVASLLPNAGSHRPGSVAARIVEAKRSGRVQMTNSSKILEIPGPGAPVKERLAFAAKVLQPIEAQKQAELAREGKAPLGKGWSGNFDNALDNPIGRLFGAKKGCVGHKCQDTHDMLAPGLKEPSVKVALEAAGMEMRSMYKSGVGGFGNHIFYSGWNKEKNKPEFTWDTWQAHAKGTLQPVEPFSPAKILGGNKFGKAMVNLASTPQLFWIEYKNGGRFLHPVSR